MTSNLSADKKVYPIDVMNQELGRERPYEEMALVTIPAWVAMEALKMAWDAALDAGGPTEYQGRMSAVRHVLFERTSAALEAAGLPGEPGEVNGQACTVRLWPADANWQPVRETQGQVRPVRLGGTHHYVAVTMQGGGEPRFIVDGQWATEVQAAAEGSVVFGAVDRLRAMARESGGATFLLGSHLEASGQTKAGSAYLAYAVVPAGL
ncbi:hypothetical protein [Deinococcus arcticus]|uniref:Uncharacterized protein n=1 Tax=Deinococcus arcticus TaxID=2136176 RepID=A0A2T3W4C3_9DEIO|nr:hypothetical protein [Deinococcus arcticus]PTA66613.1 hypothetical protein C8263_17070 [Deinococcus arcticus]